MFPYLVAGAIILSLVATAALYVRGRVRFWLGHARRMCESGYLVPPSSCVARMAWRLLTPMIVYLFVGPIEVSGRENLKVPGRKIYVANHQFELDFAVVAAATRSACPYMASTGVLKPRLAALVAAWTGAVPVDVNQRDGGKKASDASVEALLRKKNGEFVIFPQGRLLDCIKLEDFKPGAARLQQEVFEQSGGEPVWLVPMYIGYRRDARYKPVSHYWLGSLRSKFGDVNYGVRVVIGRPLACHAARSEEFTTEFIYSSVKLLQLGGA